MGSIAHIIEGPSTQPGPSSQKSVLSEPPFKSSATELVSDTVMAHYEPQHPNRGPVDEGYGSTQQMDNAFDEQESSATLDGDEDGGDAGSRQGAGVRATPNLLDGEYKKLIQQIQELRGIGIESKDLPLPKICVVGGQSAGKSSVIEAMSGIKVPRNSGCCTRCPMEINLRQSGPNTRWSCKVSLINKYMYCPGNQKKGLGPWKENEQEVPFVFCDNLTDKNDVPIALKWAQIAILNPRTPSEQYAYVAGQSPDQPDTLQVKFSPNVVRLDISAPDLQTLSFYDLPGVFTNPEREDEMPLVNVVQNLARGYIRDKTCILLLTHPMNDDFGNCFAMRLIREVRDAQNRTCGVFTKADRGADEDVFSWFRTLAHGDYQLNLGYNIVMNDPDTTLENHEARARESNFFANEYPWADLHQYQHVFGTEKLQASLSKLLYDQIRAYLPQITEKINAKIQEDEAMLAKLPDPPNDDELVHVLGSMVEFRDELGKQFIGGSHEHPFQKRFRDRAYRFQYSLVRTGPTLRQYSNSEQKRLHEAQRQQAHASQGRTPHPDVISVDDSDHEEKASMKDRRRKYDTAFSPSPAPHPSLLHGKSPKKAKSDSAGNSPKPKKVFILDEIREINMDAQGAGISIPYAEKSIERMNQASVEHWKDLMGEFLTEAERHLKEMVLGEFDKVFAKYHKTPFYNLGKQTLLDYLNVAFNEQRRYARRAYLIEFNRPFTMNDGDLEQGRKKALTNLEESRLRYRKELYVDLNLRPKTGEERVKLIQKLTHVEIGPDEFVNEIETMAFVRAYYGIACMRFADNVCQAFQAELFRNCGQEVFNELMVKLGIKNNAHGLSAQEVCKRLLALDPEIEVERTRLLSRKKRFEDARDTLANYKDPKEENPKLEEDEEMVDGI